MKLLLSQPNVGAVAVSGNEVKLALSVSDGLTSKAGHDADCVILNGNGKQRWELELAVDHGCLVNVDSVFDIRRLLAVVSDKKAAVRIMLRLNPDIDAVRFGN